MHFPSFYTPVPGSCFKAFHSLPPSESKTKNSEEITENVLSNPSGLLLFPLLSVTATAFVPFGKGGYVNVAELGCTYQDLFGNAQMQTVLIMSTVMFLTYCSAVTLRFASSNSFAASYSFFSFGFVSFGFFFLSLWRHCFYLLPNTANEARKEFVERGGGPLCGRSRGIRNPTETQKSKIFLTCHFKHCFHFLGMKMSGLYRLYNTWPLCYLTTFWINLGGFCRERAVQNVYEFSKI